MATRKYAWLLALAALLTASALVGGCTPRQAPPPDTSQSPFASEPQGEPDPEPEPNLEAIGLLDLTEIDFWTFPDPISGDQSPAVEWNDPYGPDRAILLVWDAPAQQFKGFLTPRPQEATLLQLALFAGHPLGHDPEGSRLPILSVRQEKGFVVVDLDKEAFLQLYGDAPQQGERVLASLARTLLTNHRGTEHIGFTMNGGQFVTPYLTLEGDGYGRYEAPPLYSEVSDQEYAALRQSAPYPGLAVEESDWMKFVPFANPEVAAHPQAQAIADLLYLAGDTGAFATPDELPNQLKVAQALTHLPLATTIPDYADTLSYLPQLAPIAQVVEDSEMIPREWVEQAVRELYGPDAQVLHQSVSGGKWQWHAKEGVYTPPHMGGWSGQMPYISQITQEGDRYLVTFHSIRMGMGGGFGAGDGTWVEPTVPNDYFDLLPKDPKFLNFIAGQPSRQAVLVAQGDRLILESVSIL